MRKLDASISLVLVGSIGMVASILYSGSRTPTLTLAGLSLRLNQNAVRERLGDPQALDVDGNWLYNRNDRLLTLKWAASAPNGGDLGLRAIVAMGPARLQLNGKSLPDFGTSRTEVIKVLGPPEGFLLDVPEPLTHPLDDYYYRWDGDMVVYKFFKDRASTIEICPDNMVPLPPGDKHASTQFPVRRLAAEIGGNHWI